MKLIEKNNPLLRRPAAKVSLKQGRAVGRALLKFLAALNHSRRRAIGIAANQVGIDASVCAIDLPGKNPFILVNPRITRYSEIWVPDTESCLSLMGEEYIVNRAINCTVVADNYDEELNFGVIDSPWNNEKLLESRCTQHEIHHLQGILISDIGETNDTNIKGRKI